MKYELGIIGTGNMAEAIIKGIVNANKKLILPNKIIGFDVDSNRLNQISKKYKITSGKSLNFVASNAKYILLAVKPQVINQVMNVIKNDLNQNQIIISIAAGISTKIICRYFGNSTKIIRVMPNTPALINQGVSVYFANSQVSLTAKTRVKKILSLIGSVHEIKNEMLLDAVTALSGSGPAFVFNFIKALKMGGIKIGLEKNLAYQLAIQTVLGATHLALQSEDDLDTLIKKVTSKKGTTEAGLKSLKKNKFDQVIFECLKSAKKRSKELTQLLSK